jgi:uncharacterized membrane protein
MGFLQWLESTGYSEWILVSSTGWPLMLTLHALGLATIVGIIFSMDLRLLGFYGSIPYTSIHKLLSIAWIGIALNVFTGLSIFMTQASTYVTSPPFLIKITFIILGCVNLWYMQKVLKQEASSWDTRGAVTSVGTWLAASSLVFWIIAVVTGRLIAYL